MSHVTTVPLVIRDLDLLERVLPSLGLKLTRGANTYKWYGSSVGDYPLPEGLTAQDLGKCEHKISRADGKQAYEIGLIRSLDGSGYRMVYDFWGPQGRAIEELAGSQCTKISQGYAVNLATQQAQQCGFGVMQVVALPNGTVQIVASK